MASNELLQMAAIGPVEDLQAQFNKLAGMDQERAELIRILLSRTIDFEQKIHRLTMDLEDQTKSRMTYQKEARDLMEEKTKTEHMIHKNLFVVVLVDGDGAKFTDSLLRDPISGAVEAAQRLKQAVKDDMKDTPLGVMDLPIHVRIFANLNDLARSLRLSGVIESPDDMRTFAEKFTNSRAEFDFVNVGRGKENADSKIRKMFHHFFNNIQCMKIFFAGCHDGGYMHELQEHVGDPAARERIVLVETTPAEPCYRTLGFRITRFDTVFRSEPLGNERKYSIPLLPNSPSLSSLAAGTGESAGDTTSTIPPPGGASIPFTAAHIHQSPAPVAAVMPLSASDSSSPKIPSSLPVSSSQAQLVRSPTANVTSSNNGGISINYPPSSYAAAGSGSGYQNMSVQAATRSKKPKTMDYNKDGHRLDAPSKNPGFNTPAQTTYKNKHDKVKPRAFCNNHYLVGKCKWGDKCEYDHSTNLTADEIAIHRFRARTSVCPAGPSCDDFSCYHSHHCTLDPHCARGTECKFKRTRYGDLHLSREELVAAKRWTEGIDFPTYL